MECLEQVQRVVTMLVRGLGHCWGLGFGFFCSFLWKLVEFLSTELLIGTDGLRRAGKGNSFSFWEFFWGRCGNTGRFRLREGAEDSSWLVLAFSALEGGCGHRGEESPPL